MLKALELGDETPLVRGRTLSGSFYQNLSHRTVTVLFLILSISSPQHMLIANEVEHLRYKGRLSHLLVLLCAQGFVQSLITFLGHVGKIKDSVYLSVITLRSGIVEELSII